MASTFPPALYVDSNGEFSIRRDIPTPEPGSGEVLVKPLFSGVNPADAKHSRHLGIKDTVLGYDFCGQVVRAPAKSPLEPGDVVAGYTPTGIGRPWRYGTHQACLSCPEHLLFRVPNNLPNHHAACLTVVAATAADVAFNIFGLPLPGHGNTGQASRCGPILIWGGSTSVGTCLIQFARASGAHPIFVAASTSRHKILKDLGATRCFDYRSPDVVSEIQAAVGMAGRGPITCAVDCAGTETSPSSAEMLLECAGEATNLASVIVRKDGRFQMPLATADAPATIQPKGVPAPITIPPRPECWENMHKALLWAIDEYSTEFCLPPVEVFAGTAEEALGQVIQVAAAGRFGKLALKHPLA
ncbi:hypothetical protein MKZ38_009719 [Zalerion maritima]|uniref:Enoyl reductase (ER) domain-containing protein n=1 Tax=Zalerion maritima TaxID=339359 RepID=A0AAD5RT38_9PEZI|nr:hypothetical protein MKZ38_009719 [Zalerion maritima]